MGGSSPKASQATIIDSVIPNRGRQCMRDPYPGKVKHEHVKRRTPQSTFLRKLEKMYREREKQQHNVVVPIDETARRRNRQTGKS